MQRAICKTISTINKGTGAGGANTNKYGKAFEEKTENENRMLLAGFIRKKIPEKNGKNDYYLEKEESPTRSIVYMKQGGLKAYYLHFFNKIMIRCPDEAYLIREGESYTLKVLEKKNQNGEGSVADKLQIGNYMKYEYAHCLGENCQIKYAFCISNYLKEKYMNDTIKSTILRKYNSENDIHVLFGDDEDYFSKLDEWIRL